MKVAIADTNYSGVLLMVEQMMHTQKKHVNVRFEETNSTVYPQIERCSFVPDG